MIRALLAFILLPALAIAASAAENKWAFGVDAGEAYPVSKNNFSHDVPNKIILELLGSESVGDEVGEGFVAPASFNGASTVAGSLKPMTDIGAHLYYQLRDDLELGLEGGYAVRRSLFIDNRGIFPSSVKFFTVAFEGNITHFNSMAKYGRWFGIVRPSVGLGPGLYLFREVLSVNFTDPDDPQVKPIAVVDHTLAFSGIAAGAGVDVKVTEKGTINLAVQYHKVFSPHNKLDFVLPRLQLVVLFGGGDSWF